MLTACSLAISISLLFGSPFPSSPPPQADEREKPQAESPGDWEDRIRKLEQRIDELERASRTGEPEEPDPGAWDRTLGRFTFGGYGEIHANLGEGSSTDQIDIHRMVFYLGYAIDDWIQLHSETEIEHAFVSGDDEEDGELTIEQLHIDFLLGSALNVRAGRFLTPLGIVNRKHEPTTFNGVERPIFDKFIIPTTWSSDGVGIFGKLAPDLKYEAYVVAGLDGSEFNATDGIRDGRIKERPSLHEPAGVVRLDYFPFVRLGGGARQSLRFGLSGYAGGLDNGNRGQNPGIDGQILIGSGDFEYRVDRFDFRGAAAFEKITGTRSVGNGTGSDILGYTIEAAVHCLPEAWKKGRLAKADAVLFVRYDWIDTQYEIPNGVSRDPEAEREEWTVGATWFFNPSLVFKADVQFRNDDNRGDLPTLVNFGLGWFF
jgi:hypothetical protein